ncbi:MAG: glycosyltransferase family 2 protein [Bacteroidales bacterium]|nr:glycosyltransferase family 2 protein [Bacteroidales bacterium]
MAERSDLCVIIPTYNNASTLPAVIEETLKYCKNIIVVNDGSTDNTEELLNGLTSKIQLISYPVNKGKGYALSRAFSYAHLEEYRYAITLDSDGQHYPDDIPGFIKTNEANPGAVIVGSRQLRQKHMPKKNTFANRFSNFWFTVHTLKRLPDTQTGYRLYPLYRISNMRLVTSRYETELEILVRLAWKNVPIIPLPVKVFYAPEGERITHFRKGRDFLRISLLNTIFTFLAIIYGYPSMLLRTWYKRF